MDDADSSNVGIPSARDRIQRKSSSKRHHHTNVVSSSGRVPSPPATRRRASLEGLNSYSDGYEFRVLSTPTIQRMVSSGLPPPVRHTYSFSVPPPTLNQPHLHDPSGRSFDDRDPRLRTPQSLYPMVDTGYLSPLHGVDYSSSGGDQPQRLKSWKSERIPSPRDATPTASITPPDSISRLSLALSPGVLGD